jgi:hypothetical protein
MTEQPNQDGMTESDSLADRVRRQDEQERNARQQARRGQGEAQQGTEPEAATEGESEQGV